MEVLKLLRHKQSGDLDSQADDILVLQGDLGLEDRDRVEAMLPDPALIPGRLVLDCTKVSSMDSSILALIMTYRRRMQMAGRDPVASFVAIAPPRLLRLFELTGIVRAITVLPSTEC